MSSRHHWTAIKSSVVEGDAISGCRDEETKTYRLFVNKDWSDVVVYGVKGVQFSACECCDLSIDDVKALIAVLQKAVDEHEEWSEDED